MGTDKQKLCQEYDYERLISQTLFELGVVVECPFCHMEYLTGKNEDSINEAVRNAFEKQYGESNYSKTLMEELIKRYLDERFYGHDCTQD